MSKRTSKAVAVISGDVKGVVYFEQTVSVWFFLNFQCAVFYVKYREDLFSGSHFVPITITADSAFYLCVKNCDYLI